MLSKVIYPLAKKTQLQTNGVTVYTILHQSTPCNRVITMKVIIIMTTYFRHNYFEVILNKEYQDHKY